MPSEAPSTARSRRSGGRVSSPARRWIWRAVCVFALVWMAAHFITLGALKWGPPVRHDATVLGQMIAVAAFPLLFLLAFGTRSPLRGGIIAGAVGVVALLAVLLHS